MVGRMSVWSVNIVFSGPNGAIPGPTMPSQVCVMSSWKSPWFQLLDKAACRVECRGAGRVARRGEQEIVGVGEQDEVGGSRRVLGNHVQQVLFCLVGERLRHLICIPVRPVDCIEAEQPG